MTLHTGATKSPSNDTNTTPSVIDCIPRFFVGGEKGRKFQIDHKPQEIPLDDP